MSSWACCLCDVVVCAWVFWQLVAFSAACFSLKKDTSEVDNFSRWNLVLDLSIDAWSWKEHPLCRFQLSCFFSFIRFSVRRNLWKCSRFPTSHNQEPKFLCGQKWPRVGWRNVELTIGFSPKMPFINFWLKKSTPYPLFEGVFIESHFEAKPLNAKKLPYQDVRSRASHHPFCPKMPFISFWLKKGYLLSTFWGCFHWYSFWSKTIECQ